MCLEYIHPLILGLLRNLEVGLSLVFHNEGNSRFNLIWDIYCQIWPCCLRRFKKHWLSLRVILSHRVSFAHAFKVLWHSASVTVSWWMCKSWMLVGEAESLKTINYNKYFIYYLYLFTVFTYCTIAGMLLYYTKDKWDCMGIFIDMYSTVCKIWLIFFLLNFSCSST